METIYFLPSTVDRTSHLWTLLAAGDFRVQGRYVESELPNEMARRTLSHELQDRIRAATIATINLEAPNHFNEQPPLKSGPLLSTDYATPFVLRAMGFEHVSLANNHIMDYGLEGLQCTLNTCMEAGLKTCGAGQDAYAPTLTETEGVRVALFSFCEQEFGVATGDAPGVGWIGHPKALQEVTRYSQSCDQIIVLAHGGVENVPFPPPARQQQLRSFIDAGATIVVGHHPHVPQGWERYRGGIIFYSLGNFLFDYPHGRRNPNTEWSLLVEAHFAGSTLTKIILLPVATDTDNQVVELSLAAEDYLKHIDHLSSIQNDENLFACFWQAQAVVLWTQDYWPLISSGLGLRHGIKYHIRELIKAIKRRLMRRPSGDIRLMAQGGLLLLNLIRNESHHAAIETALATIFGDIPDQRTPDIILELDAIMQRTR